MHSSQDVRPLSVVITNNYGISTITFHHCHHAPLTHAFLKTLMQYCFRPCQKILKTVLDLFQHLHRLSEKPSIIVATSSLSIPQKRSLPEHILLQSYLRNLHVMPTTSYHCHLVSQRPL